MSVIKGKDALGRRVWDKEHYRKVAEENATMRTGKVAPAQKDHLRARPDDIGLDTAINKKGNDPKGGYWCETCEVLMKDSQAYLDHLNGKNHNRLLGMSLDVEKSSAASVAARILALKGGMKRQRVEPDTVTERKPETEPVETEPVEVVHEDEEEVAIKKLIGKSSFTSRK